MPRRSVAEQCPELVAEWAAYNESAPGDVSYGSHKTVWWICPAGHPDYQKPVNQRSRGLRKSPPVGGCPTCGNARSGRARATPGSGESLLERRPDLAAEWAEENEVGPADIKPDSHRKVWWICPQGIHANYSMAPNKRNSRNSGCPPCGIDRRTSQRRAPLPGRSVADLYPELVPEWLPSNRFGPDQLKPGSDELIDWECQGCGRTWSAPVKSRTPPNPHGCQKCAAQRTGDRLAVAAEDNCLESVAPSVARQWDATRNGAATPRNVYARSNRLAYWQCPAAPDHTWQARVAERVGTATRPGTGCPYCPTAQRPRASSTNNLTLRPDLMRDYAADLNKWSPIELTENSRDEVTWRCHACGYVWMQSVNQRSQTTGCRNCSPVHRSQREIRLAAAMAVAFGTDLLDARAQAVQVDNRIRHCDIVLVEQHVVVEYDGSYHHRERESHDRQKTAELQTAGWLVIRIRERPLPLITPHDIACTPYTPVRQIVDQILGRLRDCGLPAPPPPISDSQIADAEALAEETIGRLRQTKDRGALPRQRDSKGRYTAQIATPAELDTPG